MSFVTSDAIRMAASLVPGLPGSDLPVEGFPLGREARDELAHRGPFPDGEAGPGRLGLDRLDEARDAARGARRGSRGGSSEGGEDGRERSLEEPRTRAVASRPPANGDEEPRADERDEELVDRFSREAELLRQIGSASLVPGVGPDLHHRLDRLSLSLVKNVEISVRLY